MPGSGIVMGARGSPGLLGIIAGSKVAELFVDFQEREDRTVPTPYGAVTVTLGKLQGAEVAFLPRHGHVRVPPHRVPYLTNMWALEAVGVDKIVATSAVRSLSDSAPPGTLALPNDFVDMSGRNLTFYSGAREGVYYADMMDPFCPHLRRAIDHVARSLGTPLRRDIKVLCVNGPAWETPGEAAWYKTIGADVLSMTVATEAKLAREKGICYQPILIPYNWASGANPAMEEEKVVELVRRMKDFLIDLVAALPGYINWKECPNCGQVL
jgi:5'-methylthioadenosine phosphorylase